MGTWRGATAESPQEWVRACTCAHEHTLSSRQNIRSHCWLLPRGAAPVTCPQGAASSQDWKAFSTSSPALLRSTLPTPQIQRSLTYRLGGPLLAKSPIHLSDYNDGSLPCTPHTTRHLGPTHLYLPICQVPAQGLVLQESDSVLANPVNPANPWFSKLFYHLRSLELFLDLLMVNDLTASAFCITALSSSQAVLTLIISHRHLRRIIVRLFVDRLPGLRLREEK